MPNDLPSYHAQKRASIADVAEQLPQHTTGAYLTEKAEEGFDYTTTRWLGQKFRGLVADFALKSMGEGEMLKPLTVDEIKKSPYFREGVEYEDGQTESEVALISEYHDMRRRREAVIASQPTDLTSILGFGAMMLGSLPSGESLLGFNTIKAGSTIGVNALRSAGVNMAITGIADVPVLMSLQKQGEDVGVLDAVLDIAVAGALGAGFALPGARKIKDVMRARKNFASVADNIMDMARTAAKEGHEGAEGLVDKAMRLAKNVVSERERVMEAVNTADAQVGASGKVTDVNLGENPRVKAQVDELNKASGVKDADTVVKEHVEKYGEEAWGKSYDEEPAVILDDKLNSQEPEPPEVRQKKMAQDIAESEREGLNGDDWIEKKTEMDLEGLKDADELDATVQATKEQIKKSEAHVEGTVRAAREVLEGKC